jgi:hypothetical protein
VYDRKVGSVLGEHAAHGRPVADQDHVDTGSRRIERSQHGLERSVIAAHGVECDPGGTGGMGGVHRSAGS